MVAESSLIIPEHKVGDRIECCGCYGTIKYIGPVEGYEGDWLGIDWDDHLRGKHDGTVKGVIYFKSKHPKSGSFVRREKVNFGTSLTEAIISKYGYCDHLELNEQALLNFKTITNAPFLETVGFERIAQKQSNFSALKVVDLRLCYVRSPGEPLELQKLCPNICELDLSKNLLSTWTDVFNICSQLKNIRLLRVSENILDIPDNYTEYHFPTIKILICAYMNLTWDDVVKITNVFRCVEHFILPFNRITHLNVSNLKNLQSLQIIDLEGNAIGCWDEIMKLSTLPNLIEMNLNNIQLSSIQFDDCEDKIEAFENLRKLSLNSNLINDWQSIGELNKLKNFEDLRITSNPILETETLATGNQIITAKLKNLKILRGSSIANDFRRGAEYDYIKKYGLQWLSVKDNPEKRSEFLKHHTRYLELIEKYGNPEESELKVHSNILNSNLITVNIVHDDILVKKKFPPSLLIQKLILLVQKLFKIKERPTLLYKSGHSSIEIPLDDEMKEIGFYSIQDEDAIVVL